jgi:hypothetical protein
MPAAATALAIAQSRYLLRPRLSGAAAISAVPRIAPISPDQASGAAISWPPKRGAIVKAAFDRDVTKKPVASSRSTRRPSTA